MLVLVLVLVPNTGLCALFVLRVLCRPQSATAGMGLAFLCSLLRNVPPSESTLDFSTSFLDKAVGLLGTASTNAYFKEWSPTPRVERALDTYLCSVESSCVMLAGVGWPCLLLPCSRCPDVLLVPSLRTPQAHCVRASCGRGGRFRPVYVGCVPGRAVELASRHRERPWPHRSDVGGGALAQRGDSSEPEGGDTGQCQRAVASAGPAGRPEPQRHGLR